MRMTRNLERSKTRGLHARLRTDASNALLEPECGSPCRFGIAASIVTRKKSATEISKPIPGEPLDVVTLVGQLAGHSNAPFRHSIFLNSTPTCAMLSMTRTQQLDTRSRAGKPTTPGPCAAPLDKVPCGQCRARHPPELGVRDPHQGVVQHHRSAQLARVVLKNHACEKRLGVLQQYGAPGAGPRHHQLAPSRGAVAHGEALRGKVDDSAHMRAAVALLVSSDHMYCIYSQMFR